MFFWTAQLVYSAQVGFQYKSGSRNFLDIEFGGYYEGKYMKSIRREENSFVQKHWQKIKTPYRGSTGSKRMAGQGGLQEFPLLWQYRTFRRSYSTWISQASCNNNKYRKVMKCKSSASVENNQKRNDFIRFRISKLASRKIGWKQLCKSTYGNRDESRWMTHPRITTNQTELFLHGMDKLSM